jgi:hypothetical protein
MQPRSAAVRLLGGDDFPVEAKRQAAADLTAADGAGLLPDLLEPAIPGRPEVVPSQMNLAVAVSTERSKAAASASRSRELAPSAATTRSYPPARRSSGDTSVESRTSTPA